MHMQRVYQRCVRHAIHVATNSTSTSSTCAIRAAAFIQRWPTIYAEHNNFEKLHRKRWNELQEEKTQIHKLEFEKFGVKYFGAKQQSVEKQRAKRDRNRKLKEEEDAAGPSGLRSKAMEIDEDKLFKPAPRRTEADINGDRRSLQRRLMGGVTLIVKEKDTGMWRFPEAEYDEDMHDQKLRKTASRQLKNDVGTIMKVYFMGNGPMHYVDNSTSGGDVTSKTFFFYGRYVRGDVIWNPDTIEDHAWVGNNELGDYFSEDYVQSIQPMLREFTLYPNPDWADIS